MHERLVSRTLERAERLSSDAHVTNLAERLAALLYANSPVDEGHLRLAVSDILPPQRTATGWRIGVGDKEVLGDPKERSPRGTIRQFLSDFPRFRFRVFRRGRPVSSAYAWFLLSKRAKQVLQEERQRGKYGGETGLGAGRTPYVWQQEGGNTGAGITGQRFIAESVAAWRSFVALYLEGLRR